MATKTNVTELPLASNEPVPYRIRVEYSVKCRIQKLRGGFISREIHSHATFSNIGPDLNTTMAKQQLEVHLFNKYKARRIKFINFSITEVTPA